MTRYSTRYGTQASNPQTGYIGEVYLESSEEEAKTEAAALNDIALNDPDNGLTYCVVAVHSLSEED